MNLAAIDIVFIGIIIIFSLHCCVKGFVAEILSIAAMILGILSAIFFFRRGAVFIRDSFMPEMKIVPEILAFIAIFLIVFVIIKILQIMLKNIIEGIHLGGLDRVLGLLFGFAEGIVIVCLLLFLISIQPFIDTGRILEGSFFAELLLPFVMGIKKETTDMISIAAGCKKGFTCV